MLPMSFIKIVQILLLIFGQGFEIVRSQSPLRNLLSNFVRNKHYRGTPSWRTPDPPESRIYKGWRLSPHEFPWMVKIKVRHGKAGHYFALNADGRTPTPKLMSHICLPWAGGSNKNVTEVINDALDQPTVLAGSNFEKLGRTNGQSV